MFATAVPGRSLVIPFVTAVLCAVPWLAATAQRPSGIDPGSPLASRVGATPPSVLKMFTDEGMHPTAHALTAAERERLSRAFAALPPLQRRVLAARLRTVSFLDGMPNTALTSPVEPEGPFKLFDMTIRAGIFGEDVSVFLTQKERTCFDSAGSARSVSIEAGSLDAILYVLLHEATHVVDGTMGLSPAGTDVWTDRTTAAARYREPLLEGSCFRAGGRPLPVERAEGMYDALRRTPFASLYASNNWHDDLAELLALYHVTERLGQPYRIVVRDGSREVYLYRAVEVRCRARPVPRAGQVLRPLVRAPRPPRPGRGRDLDFLVAAARKSRSDPAGGPEGGTVTRRGGGRADRPAWGQIPIFWSRQLENRDLTPGAGPGGPGGGGGGDYR